MTSFRSPPQRLLEDLVRSKPQDERYLSIANQLVFDVNKFNLGRLFQDLDRNRDGILDVNDFSDPDQNRQTLLTAVYQRIRSEFDFDSNGMISFQEFVDGFILEAWLSVPPESGLTQNMTIGDELHYWATRFNRELEHRMEVFNGACRVNPGRAAKQSISMSQPVWPGSQTQAALNLLMNPNEQMEIDTDIRSGGRKSNKNNYNNGNNNFVGNNGFNSGNNKKNKSNNFNNNNTNNFNNNTNNFNNNFNNINNNAGGGSRGNRRNSNGNNPFATRRR